MKKLLFTRENGAYLGIWLALYLAPMIMQFVLARENEADFTWNGAMLTWLQMTAFLITFLLHNFLVAPLLIFKKKPVLYFVLAAGLLALFVFVQNSYPSRGHNNNQKQQVENTQSANIQKNDTATVTMQQVAPSKQDEECEKYRRNRRVKFMTYYEVMITMIMTLLFGINLGLKQYFKSRRDQEKMRALLQQHTEEQLTYLKYQISPHFLMNTLNNIHALVDIDQEKARDTIIKLSHLLRHSLYDTDHSTETLGKEMEFISTYIDLMKLRYTDNVSINITTNIKPCAKVPSMIFATFVENAFKHGVTYEHDSTIDINVVTTDSEIVFTCRNTKPKTTKSQKLGGLGLANARKRLDLLYAGEYSIDIQDTAEYYNVVVKLPLTLNCEG